jgi:hypothetical protein
MHVTTRTVWSASPSSEFGKRISVPAPWFTHALTHPDMKRSLLQDHISKRQAHSECVVRVKVKRSDVDVRTCGKRTANALCGSTRIDVGGMTASRVNGEMTRGLTRRNPQITQNDLTGEWIGRKVFRLEAVIAQTTASFLSRTTHSLCAPGATREGRKRL